MKHYLEVDIGLSESAKKTTLDDLEGVIFKVTTVKIEPIAKAMRVTGYNIDEV